MREPADGNGWKLEAAVTSISGFAVGAERLTAVGDGLSTIWDTVELQDLVRLTLNHAGYVADAALEDARMLVDQLRALWLVLQDVKVGCTVAQLGWIDTMARRARRRIEWLQVADWRSLVKEFEAELQGTLGSRYEGVDSQVGVATVIANLPWPGSWNPESYRQEG